MKTIKINEIIKSNLAVNADQAEEIYDLIKNYVDKQQEVGVDFSDIDTLTTAFLNIAIGKLYSIGDTETLNKYVHISSIGLSKFQLSKIKLVMKNAKTKINKADMNKELYND